MSENQQFINRFARLFGFFALIAGSGMSYMLWNRALKLAEEKAGEIPLYGKSFSFFVSFSVLGILLILFGSKIQEYSSTLKSQKKNARDWLFIGLIVAPGVVAYQTLRWKLSKLGYDY